MPHRPSLAPVSKCMLRSHITRVRGRVHVCMHIHTLRFKPACSIQHARCTCCCLALRVAPPLTQAPNWTRVRRVWQIKACVPGGARDMRMLPPNPAPQAAHGPTSQAPEETAARAYMVTAQPAAMWNEHIVLSHAARHAMQSRRCRRRRRRA